MTAQLARFPLLDDVVVGTEVCIGPNADKPLWLDIPIFVSDMSFGALSLEAKTALGRGAELAGTGTSVTSRRPRRSRCARARGADQLDRPDHVDGQLRRRNAVPVEVDGLDRVVDELAGRHRREERPDYDPHDRDPDARDAIGAGGEEPVHAR